jgi:hypothetical protein
MIENTGGIGKPFDYTSFGVQKAYKMDETQDLKETATPSLGTESQLSIEKDVLDWQTGSKIQQNKVKHSLKNQIEESRKRLVDSKANRAEDAKKSKFIGKVTYEFEAYPCLDSNFDEIG